MNKRAVLLLFLIPCGLVSAQKQQKKVVAKKSKITVSNDPAVNTKIDRCLSIGADALPSADTCPYNADFGTTCCACAIDMAQEPGWGGILASKRYNPQTFFGACSAQCGIEFATPCEYICNQAFPGPHDCSSPSPESPRACALFQAKRADCLKRCGKNSNGLVNGAASGVATFFPKKPAWGNQLFCAQLANVICAGDASCAKLVTQNCMNGGKTYFSEHAKECADTLKNICADTSVCKGNQACLNDTKCTAELQTSFCKATSMPMFECGNADTCLTVANELCKMANEDVFPVGKDEEICRDADGKRVDCACRDAFVKNCMGTCDFSNNEKSFEPCVKACHDKAKSSEFLSQFQDLGRGGPFGWCERLNCNADCPDSVQPGPLCKSCLRKCLYQAATAQQKQMDCIQTACAGAQTGDTSCITKCQAQHPIIDCRFYCMGKANDCGIDQKKLDFCDQKYPCNSTFEQCNYQVGSQCKDADSECAQTIGVGKYFSTCNSEFGSCNCQPSADSCYMNYLCKTMAYPNAGCKG